MCVFFRAIFHTGIELKRKKSWVPIIITRFSKFSQDLWFCRHKICSFIRFFYVCNKIHQANFNYKLLSLFEAITFCIYFLYILYHFLTEALKMVSDFFKSGNISEFMLLEKNVYFIANLTLSNNKQIFLLWCKNSMFLECREM